ncbi:MAG: hypothetical protein ACSNEK_08415 [Parachlamydiaceae bacterium]
MIEQTTKRLFIGFEIDALWPENLPSARIIPPNSRHFTLSFLGNQPLNLILPYLQQMPKPSFKIGRTGYFNSCLFLPDNHANVVAWQGHWLDNEQEILNYEVLLHQWLNEIGLHIQRRDHWLCHATIARKPLHMKAWLASFRKLPFFISHLHLYESLPELNYRPLWSHPFLPPFEEIEHTADLAYKIKGMTINELFSHAYCALSWRFPELLDFLPQSIILKNLDDLIILLNESITQADCKTYCPYKAISFHGSILERPNYLEWEMIVDV